MTIKGPRGGPSPGHPEFETAAQAARARAREKNPLSEMPRNPKIQVEWQQDDKMWLIAGGKLEEPTVISSVELRERFPVFLRAAEEYVKDLESPLSDDELESLLGCAANSLAEIVPSRQRFAVYRAVAFFLGFKERTQLPEGLEEAIKQTWTKPGEAFVGYQEG
ncbi:hypothetical protein R1sor_018518 [Riccia sorocarpa]|uniref:Uncharacterized protein n=1 Tax=Riccia sorocarpa TaxID=122646 RepID=A0ABD3IE01_9MARC